MNGPLTGYRIVEIAGIGPGPFAAMMLADLGADVIRVDRASSVKPSAGPNSDVLTRGRRSIAVDLKHPDGVATLLDLVATADALIEGFRPGVMERLGIGPAECHARNKKLVFGRMTGWGQDGPWASAAGHDINYISLAGALSQFRRGVDERPMPPLNLVGDFGGGGMFLALGVVAAILEAQQSGEGQVVDAAMVDGTAVLMAMFWGWRRNPSLHDESAPGSNLLDTGPHYYDVYECADGTYVSIGAIEPAFYNELLERLGLGDDPDFARPDDKDKWPELTGKLADLFRTKTRAEWCALLDGSDACFAPVLSMAEAAEHPHNAARATFVEVDGVVQPAPAPRFSRSTLTAGSPARPGEHTREILTALGIDDARIDQLVDEGAVSTT